MDRYGYAVQVDMAHSWKASDVGAVILGQARKVTRAPRSDEGSFLFRTLSLSFLGRRGLTMSGKVVSEALIPEYTVIKLHSIIFLEAANFRVQAPSNI